MDESVVILSKCCDFRFTYYAYESKQLLAARMFYITAHLSVFFSLPPPSSLPPAVP